MKRQHRHITYTKTKLNGDLAVDMWAESDRLVLSCGDCEISLTKLEADIIFRDGLDLVEKIEKSLG